MTCFDQQTTGVRGGGTERSSESRGLTTWSAKWWPTSQLCAFLVTTAVVVSVVITQPTQAIPEATGPGVAGMIHALAYDPEVPGRIYAGGDVCGVYQSNDNGISWNLIDRGLESSDLTNSFYVDDLIVIGEPDSGAPVHSQRLGVYAATHGGVYFRPQGSQFWQLMTDYNLNPVYWFGTGPGVAIPFSCFGYDRRNGILYAGTGHGRRDNADGTAWKSYYPEASPQTVEQYSIWKLDLKVAGSVWVPIPSTDRKGIVRQIAISDVNNDTDEDIDVTYVAFSSRSGLYCFEDGDLTCTNLLDFDKSEPSEAIWSGKAWGVAAGSNNILYTILTEALPDGESTVLRPAVWYFDLAENVPTRVFLDPSATVLPHGGTWVDFIATNLGFEIFSLTVIAGESGASDEVYIGTGGTVYGGLWRYGDFVNNGVQSRGWIATILFSIPAVWDEFEYNYINYLNDPISPTPFEPGWLDNYALHATTPLVYHPLDHDEKFHMAYAIPMAMDADLPGVWSPRNCQGSGSFWASNGLNLMCPRDCAFLSDGRLVIGAIDFTAFIGADASCETFRWLSRLNIGSKDVNDIEIVEDEVEDEIYFVRTG